MTTQAELSAKTAALAQRARTYVDAPHLLQDAIISMGPAMFEDFVTDEQRQGAWVVLHFLDKFLSSGVLK